MSTKAQDPIAVEDLVTKFRERNQRPPRNAGELTQFCKQLRGIKPISYADARKYFQQREQKKKERSSTSSDEEKQMEEKQPEEESSEQQDASATEEAIYQVGDQVTLTKDRSGIIRFVGPVDFAEGTWYGIELHEQFVGKCDGTKDGKRYFECNAKRGIFVREDKIRRRMSRADHARKNTWMQVHAERNSKLRITVDDDDEERDEEQESPKETTDEKEEKDENDEEQVVVSPENDGEDDQQPEDAPANAVEDAEESNQEESSGDLVVVNEPSETVTIPDADVSQKKRKSVTFSVEETLVPDRQISDYFPASEGQNVLQWVANQADLRLRADLFDLYLNSATCDRLGMVFEHLKTFEDYEQENLLSVDVLPRLCRDAI